jgi:hypothetical protein
MLSMHKFLNMLRITAEDMPASSYFWQIGLGLDVRTVSGTLCPWTEPGLRSLLVPVAQLQESQFHALPGCEVNPSRPKFVGLGNSSREDFMQSFYFLQLCIRVPH